jgi:hypothetical protein
MRCAKKGDNPFNLPSNELIAVASGVAKNTSAYYTASTSSATEIKMPRIQIYFEDRSVQKIKSLPPDRICLLGEGRFW